MRRATPAAQSLWERGAKIHRGNKDIRTPIFAACQKGHVDAVRLLLVLGAQTDWADEDRTPLDIAKAVSVKEPSSRSCSRSIEGPPPEPRRRSRAAIYLARPSDSRP